MWLVFMQTIIEFALVFQLEKLRKILVRDTGHAPGRGSVGFRSPAGGTRCMGGSGASPFGRFTAVGVFVVMGAGARESLGAMQTGGQRAATRGRI